MDNLPQDSIKRAWRDTWSWILNTKVGYVFGAIVLGALTNLFISPSEDGLWARLLIGAIGAVVGLGVLVFLTFIVHLLITPYRQRNEAITAREQDVARISVEKDTLQEELKTIKNSKPHIAYHSKGEWPFYPKEGPLRGQLTHRAVEVWFINSPITSSDNAVAQKVTCSIVFYSRNTKPLSIFGCFTRAEAYGLATIQDLTNDIDEWHPNNEPRKVVIALKLPGDDSAFAFTKEGLLSHPDGRAPDAELNKGNYYIKLEFQGTGIGQPPFWFMFTNPGKEGYLSITEPIEPPDLRKEGFQTE